MTWPAGINAQSDGVSATAAIGDVLRWNGPAWVTMAIAAGMVGGGAQLVGVSAVSAAEVYVTTDAGAVWLYNGTVWSQVGAVTTDLPANAWPFNAGISARRSWSRR